MGVSRLRETNKKQARIPRDQQWERTRMQAEGSPLPHLQLGPPAGLAQWEAKGQEHPLVRKGQAPPCGQSRVQRGGQGSVAKIHGKELMSNHR